MNKPFTHANKLIEPSELLKACGSAMNRIRRDLLATMQKRDRDVIDDLAAFRNELNAAVSQNEILQREIASLRKEVDRLRTLV